MTKISFLNHSSFLVDADQSSLLVDPWLQGSAFSGGWALEWQNTEAFKQAQGATHIWISHPHSDHLHFETLKALAELNPEMIFLGNDNSMIDMNQIVSKIPWKRQETLSDRETYSLDHRTKLMTVPSMAIDYALAYYNDDLFILNINDAIIDASTVQTILNKNESLHGRKPDVICINFSHAHKIFEEDFETLKTQYMDRLKSFLNVFNPQLLIPIASFHLYTGDLAKWQNSFRVRLEDLSHIDRRICNLLPGSVIEANQSKLTILKTGIPEKTEVVRNYPRPIDSEALKETVAQFSRKLRREFFGSIFFPPELTIYFEDLKESYRIDLKKGTVQKSSSSQDVDLRTYSSALFGAMTKPFGFDAFYVAADFEVSPKIESRSKVKKFLFFGCLVDYSLTPRNIVASLFRKERWLFLWNRREQLYYILRNGYSMGGVS